MVPLAAIQDALHRLYIGSPSASLRQEDQKKAAELAGLLPEIGRVLPKARTARPMTLVDAAAGKAYVGILVAEFILSARGQTGNVILIERDARRAAGCRDAVTRMQAPGVIVTVVETDVADRSAWPARPDLVVALHACGTAADAIADAAAACEAKHLLLVPCCTSEKVRGAELAARRAETWGIPRHAEVRRRFVQAMVDAERTLRLEASGYETVVVPFVPPTLTPHNLLWRARRTIEAGRMAEAAEHLRRLL
jgi:hypothetical protein